MQKTIFTILTNKDARRAEVIEANLDKEFSVGAPWFNKSTGDFTDIETKQ